MRDVDFYMEGDKLVFKPYYLLKRGYCCNTGCRHCPYVDGKKPTIDVEVVGVDDVVRSKK